MTKFVFPKAARLIGLMLLFSPLQFVSAMGIESSSRLVAVSRAVAMDCARSLRSDTEFVEDVVPFTLTRGMREQFEASRLNFNYLKDLFRNRVSRMLKQENGRYWFLSTTDNGLRFKIVVALDITKPDVLPVVLHMQPSNPSIERAYYRQLGERYEEATYALRRPLRGHRKLRIDGHIQIKLFEKHGLTPDQVVQSLEFFDGRYYQNPDTSHQIQGNSFVIYGHLEGKMIKLVVAEDPPGVLSLITAYEVHRRPAR